MGGVDEPGVTEERGKIPVKGPFVTSFLTSPITSLSLLPSLLFLLSHHFSFTSHPLFIHAVGRSEQSERYAIVNKTEGNGGESVAHDETE